MFTFCHASIVCFQALSSLLTAVTTISLTELILAIEQADSPVALISAVRALSAARSPDAIPMLIRVLGFNNPGAAVAAVDGLVQLGEEAVEPLLEQLDGYNYGARAYAIRALAAIADPRALGVLLEAAETDFAPSVRRAATKGLGFLDWHKLPDEAITHGQAAALKSLLYISHDPDWALRYAAVVGLQALASRNDSAELVRVVLNRLGELLQLEVDAATRARVRFAQRSLHIWSDRLLAASR